MICDKCERKGLVGARFQCDECYNYDLCKACFGKYMSDLSKSGKSTVHAPHNFNKYLICGCYRCLQVRNFKK